MIGIATGVQNLQRDLSSFRMDGIRHDAMVLGLPAKRELRSARFESAAKIRRDAAGDDQCNAAARAFRVESGKLRVPIGRFLEPGVHRPHQDAVRKRCEAEVEGRQQMRIR